MKYITLITALIVFSCSNKKLEPEAMPQGLMSRSAAPSVTWTDLNKVIAVNTAQDITIKKLQDSLTALKAWVNLPETLRADLPLEYYYLNKQPHIRLNTP